MNESSNRNHEAMKLLAQIMGMATAMGVDAPIQLGQHGRPITTSQYNEGVEQLQKQADAKEAAIQKNNLKQARKAALRLKYRQENK